MYVGHFAVGIALKAFNPKVPALPIFFGVGFLDILDGVFVITGLNKVTANLDALPYLFFDLTFIDWDHSLLMALFWSIVWGAVFIRNKSIAAIAVLACFSHFLADWPMHNSDLALYPHGDYHLGGGLWGTLGIWSWVLEGAFAAILVAYSYRRLLKQGINPFWLSILLVVLFLQLSPWLSPMRYVAMMGEPAAHLLHGALVMIGFLLPSLILTALINRGEQQHTRKA